MPTTNDLYNAIADNKLEEVKNLIENGEGLSYSHAYDYSSPLLQAAESGHLEIVQYLLDRKYCCVDDGNDQTWYSPLIVACENGHAEISELLLKHGANVARQYEKETESDETYATYQEQGYPLTLAVENGHTEIVRLLLCHRADTESIRWSYDGQWNSEETPLLLALRQNSFEIAELLLKHGADIDGECLVNGETCTPLSYAMSKKMKEWIDFLTKNGADISKKS
ncbi:ankyrin repeat domain-containing protein [Trichlorobacter ammonificans]|uniref:ANK_REP_REGION domain-containing protein n=1 Tax=Trichlorobacter ammonificans TaxID=2916410 RepID=A0ABN8HK38_9BACT|nr:ankyrin repeat domain-containing protein [Trichlorobacter ammonificans]CAH2031670.1 ANK_REP_REGION domain-containing protein [Trichlorobacter ammonificans]